MGDVQVITGDCLDVLRGMEAESFDAVVTDPPFGIGFRYDAGVEDHDTPEGYWSWLRPRYAEMMRVLKPGGFFACWQAGLYLRHLWDWFGHGIRIYAACKNFVQIRPTPLNWFWDPVVMLYKDGAKPLMPPVQGRSADWGLADTASVVGEKRAKGHPCPRPLAHVKDILRNFALPGGRVLDCFAGSGTVGVACHQTGRDCVLVESSPAYVEVIRGRLAETKGEAGLFAPALFPAAGKGDAP